MTSGFKKHKGGSAGFGSTSLTALSEHRESKGSRHGGLWMGLLPMLCAACALEPVPERALGGLVPLGKNAQGAEEFVREADGMVVILVPGGEFVRGDDMGDPEERPQRTAKVERAFLIDKFEVTNEQFAAFLKARGGGHCDSEGRWLVDWRIPGFVRTKGDWLVASGRERHPVAAATLWGAQAYAEWVGGRLPTGLEWELAARGSDGRDYPWGDETPDASRCNFLPSGLNDSAPVGAYPRGASPYGVMDMAGNLYERVLVPGRAGGRGGSTGLTAGGSMIRSGCFISPLAFQMRASDVCGYAADQSHATVGFRCAMDAPVIVGQGHGQGHGQGKQR